MLYISGISADGTHIEQEEDHAGRDLPGGKRMGTEVKRLPCRIQNRRKPVFKEQTAGNENRNAAVVFFLYNTIISDSIPGILC